MTGDVAMVGRSAAGSVLTHTGRRDPSVPKYLLVDLRRAQTFKLLPPEIFVVRKSTVTRRVTYPVFVMLNSSFGNRVITSRHMITNKDTLL